MPDNLSVTLEVKQGKFLADLKLAQAALKSLNSEMTALTKTAQQSGDRTAVDAMSPKIVAAQKEVVRLTTAWKSVAPSVNVATRSVGVFGEVSNRELIKLSRSFGNLSKSAEIFGTILGGAFGGFTGGLIARGIASAFDGFLKLLDESSKRLTDLQEQARQAGTKPIALQAAQEIAQRTGAPIDDASKMISGMGELIEKTRVELNQTPGAVKVFTGGMHEVGKAADEAGKKIAGFRSTIDKGVFVGRGGTAFAPMALDFTKPLDIIGVDLRKFTADAKGALETQKAIEQGFLRMKGVLDPQRLNALSKALFQGLPAESALELAPKLIADLDKQMAALEQSQRGATDARLKETKEANAAAGEAKTAWQELGSAIANIFTPWQTAFNKFQSESFPTLTKLAKDAGKNFNDNNAENIKGIQNFSTNFLSVVQKMETSWSAMTNWLSKTWNAAISSLTAPPTSFGDPSIPAMPTGPTVYRGGASDAVGSAGEIGTPGTSSYSAAPPKRIDLRAAGGFIRGRGTGTSDSILARLSNGEFVLNAGSVRRLGVGFLEGLNSFAAGGLVTPLPRFAEGGLAGAGGTPVHLHLGGHSFALSGSESVVGSLVVEAHRHKIRSAGVKPSWYGGTPGR